jgi:hypothetical protein
MYGSPVEVVGREEVVCGRVRKLTVARMEVIDTIMMAAFRDGTSVD